MQLPDPGKGPFAGQQQLQRGVSVPPASSWYVCVTPFGYASCSSLSWSCICRRANGTRPPTRRPAAIRSQRVWALFPRESVAFPSRNVCYSCLSVSSRVLACACACFSPFFTSRNGRHDQHGKTWEDMIECVLPCLPVSFHVFPCLPMSSHVFPCLPMSSHVFPCLPLSYRVFPSLQKRVLPVSCGCLLLVLAHTG